MGEGSLDEPICDDPASPSYNVPEKVDAFVSYAIEQAAAYPGHDIMLTMGSGRCTLTNARMCYGGVTNVCPADFDYENADTASRIWLSGLVSSQQMKK